MVDCEATNVIRGKGKVVGMEELMGVVGQFRGIIKMLITYALF